MLEHKAISRVQRRRLFARLHSPNILELGQRMPVGGSPILAARERTGFARDQILQMPNFLGTLRYPKDCQQRFLWLQHARFHYPQFSWQLARPIENGAEQSVLIS